ncbi:hypothetical protein ATE37_01815 [Streptococcus oralis subsp. tigurinus]|uniref:Phage protein n=1 Tax=Streptococcus oralis subsp. tigurinus TaxID=1077464 RepID=A0A1X0WZ38_STROR|nr:hypothetical protein [Streptococcus oralis]ORJ32080.1 hypothetical protein ATE37_01815 [Streptococcus oralis subsp. tigurinus]
MKYNKQIMIDGLKRSIEQASVKIEKLSEPCVKSLVHSRSAECDFWKKKLKKMEAQLEELENESGRID